MVEVTQADRDAAERLAIGKPSTCFDCKDELTFAFAAHRLAAIAEGRRQMREEAAQACNKLHNDDRDWDNAYWNQAVDMAGCRIRAISIGDG